MSRSVQLSPGPPITSVIYPGIIALSVAVIVVSMWICVKKGRPLLAALGFFFPLLPVIGALVPATPGSRWTVRSNREHERTGIHRG